MSAIRFGDKGSKVKSLQQALIERGYDLPRYGADGDLGDECWEALARYARDEELEWHPQIPKEVLEALNKAPPHAAPLARGDLDLEGVEVYDLRDKAKNPHHKSKTVHGQTVRRAASKVVAITIHQTAVKFGIKSYQISAAGGDAKLALARRAYNVACHALAFHDGFISLAAPMRWYIYHANTLNRRSLGLEIDGNYPGLIGGRTNNNKTATTVTDNLIRAARMAVKLLMEEGRKAGCPIEYIHAHRQSSKSRRADPGEALWRQVVLEYAVPVLGLKTQPEKTWGNGRPIPREWDPEGVGAY